MLYIIVSVAIISLGAIEIISAQFGDLSVLGFNLTEQQQVVYSYIASLGLGSLGGIGLIAYEFITKRTRELQGDTIKVAENFIQLKDKYDKLEVKYDSLSKNITNLNLNFNDKLDYNTERLNRLIELEEVNIKAKLSNPLIEKEVKRLMEGKLNQNGDNTSTENQEV